METNKLVVGNNYFISYIGDNVYNDYRGDGIYTGNSKIINDEAVFEFELPDGNSAYSGELACFPLNSIFDIKQKQLANYFPLNSIFEEEDKTDKPADKPGIIYINGYCFETGFWSEKPIKCVLKDGWWIQEGYNDNIKDESFAGPIRFENVEGALGLEVSKYGVSFCDPSIEKVETWMLGVYSVTKLIKNSVV